MSFGGDWPRTGRLLPWLCAVFLGFTWLVPSEAITLPVGIELPLSVPMIVAGIRTALVINVGTASLAAYINAGGLGRIIMAGMSTNRLIVQIVGAVLTAVLALLIDYLAGLAEDLLRPAGL